MFKNVIAPIQLWLLGQGRCVGCGRDLESGKSTTIKGVGQRIVCDCGRIFIKEAKTNLYRRALLNEA
ncbi:MAG: hypothetical protein HY376_01600 [Candidatus Blackburnbacteria bacterium]|nr:hypothetical protein [Candidatus Blackburnbacteria bacterium]